MQSNSILWICLLLALISTVIGSGFRPFFHYPVIPQVAFDSYSWMRVVETITIQEQGASIDSGPRIWISSPGVSSEGIHAAQSIIDFSTTPYVEVIQIYGICYIMPVRAGLTYAGVKADLAARNGTTEANGTLTVRYHNATSTGDLLNYHERLAFFHKNPSFSKICSYNSPIFNVTPASEFPFPDSASEAGACNVVKAGIGYNTLERIVSVDPFNYYCLYGSHPQKYTYHHE